MAAEPLSDIVSAQYERWVYPEPIMDLPNWLQSHWQWFDPAHAQPLFWPDRPVRTDLDILIAGCGTNQAAVIAFCNPQARILAVDVSQSSLSHEQFLKDKYNLHNLELLRHPIEQLGELGRSFDLIMSTGVLHHMDEPKAGIKALAQCLRPDGVIALMLYARFGRLGVEMMQSVFREMGLKQDEPSLAIVKDVVTALPSDHPLKSYVQIAPDLQFDAGVVDTFLHGRDRSYTIDDCFDLAESAELVVQDLFLKSSYHPSLSTNPTVLGILKALPKRQLWSIMERLNFRNGCHFFTVCHKTRDESTYRIDFDGERVMQFKPQLRYRCALDGAMLSRPGWQIPLEQTQQALLRLADGHRTIEEIVSQVRQTTSLASFPLPQAQNYAKEFFKSIWETDFIAVRL
jgi:SAM-dependent methyltransferase